jgi:hypothetical protein
MTASSTRIACPRPNRGHRDFQTGRRGGPPGARETEGRSFAGFAHPAALAAARLSHRRPSVRGHFGDSPGPATNWESAGSRRLALREPRVPRLCEVGRLQPHPTTQAWCEQAARRSQGSPGCSTHPAGAAAPEDDLGPTVLALGTYGSPESTRQTLREKEAPRPNSLTSASAVSSQNPISISRYIVSAVARDPRASFRLPARR